MSQTLYLKYRPQKFEELIGQEHIKITLENEIENDKIAHAYLFLGPRGIGKTTLARVFAKAINCQNRSGFEPCNECNNCKSITSGNNLDLIEIDAASNRGINEIRELRERVKYPPTNGKYKVFIIDEAHMLTIEAFNALLKTLEEPPKHAIFILATTEAHKLPATIISRCEKFEFKVIDLDKLKNYMKNLCSFENIQVDDEVLEQIARHSGGYVRDALSMLGQVLSLSDGEKITMDVASLILPKSDFELIIDIVENIISQQFDFAIKNLDRLITNGIDLQYFTEELINYLRRVILVRLSGASQEYLWDIDKNIEAKIIEQSEKLNLETWHGILDEFYNTFEHLKNDRFKQLPIEIAIISIKTKYFDKKEDENKNSFFINPSSSKKEDKKESKLDEKKEKNISETKQGTKKINSTVEDIIKVWSQLLINLKDHNHSLSAFVKVGHPKKIDNDKLIIGFQYKFHLDRIMDSKNKKIIEEILSGILNEDIFITGEIDDDYEENHKKMIIVDNKENIENDVADNLIQSFGGEVV